MDEQRARLARVGYPRRTRFGRDEARIPHLPAAFGIEGRLVDDDLDLLALGCRLDFGAVPDQRLNLALGLFGVIAQELGRAVAVSQFEPDGRILRLARPGPGGAGLGLLFGHRRIKAGDLDPAPLFAQRVLRQVQRKAVGVIQPEGRLARQVRPFGQPPDFVRQQPQPPVERLAEAGFLAAQRFLDHRLRAGQFGIGRAHLADQRRNQTVHQRILRPQHVRMAHGAAHDAAQHIAAALVRRHHPVRDQKAGGPQVVGDDAVMDLAGAVGVAAGCMGARLDQRAHQVGVIVVVLALQQRADPFQPHAGVDRGVGQRFHAAILELLELHEDEVPDLDEPIPVLVGRTGRAAPDRGAVVIEDFGAGAAGAGRAHLPEIVIGGDADDAVVGQPRDLFPDIRRLVIGVIDGDQQLVLGNPEIAGQQFPGIGDGLFLEIVAKAEIAQHFKEGMVARGVTHIVEVVVLAAGAHAFLRRGRAGIVAVFQPGEQVLELHHPRIGEHQRRVVARHQGRAFDAAMAVPFVEVEEGRADVVQTGHGRISCRDLQRRYVSAPPPAVQNGRRRRPLPGPDRVHHGVKEGHGVNRLFPQGFGLGGGHGDHDLFLRVDIDVLALDADRGKGLVGG